MLEPLREILETKRIILASKSPCRQFILNTIKLKYETIVSNYAEDLDKGEMSAEEYVIQTAYHKGLKVRDSLKDPYELIIAADTMIRCEGQVFGKAKDEEDARRQLKMFSNNVHQVLTGVVLFWSDGQEDRFVNVSDVKFSDISSSIDDYLKTKEYEGKAGSYAIQGLGGTFAEKIDGDYYNIVGLPLNQLCQYIFKHYKQ